MGLYIEGMEIPTDGEKLYMIVFSDGKACASYKPFEWHEVVPVPAHGDLIERGALDVIGYCDIPQGYEDTFDSGVMWLAERIDELPTIIPASEEGE